MNRSSQTSLEMNQLWLVMFNQAMTVLKHGTNSKTMLQERIWTVNSFIAQIKFHRLILKIQVLIFSLTILKPLNHNQSLIPTLTSSETYQGSTSLNHNQPQMEMNNKSKLDNSKSKPMLR